MKNKFISKQVIIVALIIIIIGAVVYSININKKPLVMAPTDNNVINIVKKEPIEMCYYLANKTNNGFYDTAWLKLNILGEKVTGEFRNLPAEKDSKIGSFEGTVGPLDQKIMARTATVWWNSLAEGMNVKEELTILFGDGSATVGFGEMVNRGDGVYVYKDKTKLTYIKSMSQIDCVTLDEKLFTEKYIMDNIKTLATNKPVLGGTWHVTSVIASPIAHNGEVTYEDGHIQSKANFIYTYQNNPQNVTITTFKVIK